MDHHPAPGLDATELLESARTGEASAVDRLMPLLYDELHGMAQRRLAREHSNHSLQTTGLVHEAYLKLVDATRVTQRGRAYFFAAAAHAMRQVLIDHARRRNAAKRGGGAAMVTLGEDHGSVDAYAAELLDLDRALERLAQCSPRQVKVVEYRFFAGLSAVETAEALGVSPRTVESDWAMARAWLFAALGGAPGSAAEGDGA